MKQALHILRKDFRYFRAEIAVVAAFAVLYAWAATRSANPVWAEILLAAAGAHMIARLIHAEALPGDTQFWLTRPYRKHSLLAAKLAGVVLFVNLPMFLSRAFVLHAAGFPIQSTLMPLAWSHTVLFLGGIAPIAAIAAVTPSLVAFIFSILILTAAILGLDAVIVPPSLPAVRQSLTASQWVWTSFAVSCATVASVAVLWAQYRWRRTWISRSVLLSGGLAGAALYAYLPWTAAAAIQVAVSAGQFDPRSVHVRLEPAARQFFSRGMMRSPGFQIDVPMVIEGITADVEAIPDGVTLTLQAADGTSWSSGDYVYPAVGKRTHGQGQAILNADVDVPKAFFEKVKAQRVKLTGSLYLTVFGQAQEATIPVQAGPAAVGNGMFCGLAALRRYACVSPLRWPGRLVYARFDDRGPLPFTRVLSYSPFPSGLSFDVTELRDVGAPPNAREVTIVQQRLISSFRRDFEFDDFPLAAMSMPIGGTQRRE